MSTKIGAVLRKLSLSVGVFLISGSTGFGLWTTPDETQDGWKRFDWYGWVVDTGADWIYHAEHGWSLALEETDESVWFHDSNMGWAWTSVDAYPFYYLPSTQVWLAFEQGTGSPRYFFDPATTEWIAVYKENPAPPVLSDSSYNWRHTKFTESEEHELLSWVPGQRNVVTTQFNTKVIENDLLKITLLPDWGARILSIYYKPQNMELLSYAKGDKYSEIIIADGAFYYDNWLLLPGGINPTFPEGEHGKYWGEVWGFQSIEETDTYTTVRMSRTDDLEWAGHPEKFDNGLTGMTVDMDITIRRNRACVEISYTLTNNKNITIPYEFWMAASLAPLPPELTTTSSNLEIVMKQEKILLKDWWNWLKSVESDDSVSNDDVYLFDQLAWLYNWQGSGIAYAHPLMDNPWWGVINHDYNWGVLRTADDPSVSPGMKIWSTGANYGMFELWSGNSSEFFNDAFLSPLEVKSWKEYFIPTVDLSAISFANSHGAAQAQFNYGSLTGSVDLSVFSTWQPANWKLQIFAIPESGNPILLREALLNFTPDAPTQYIINPFPMDSLPSSSFRVEALLFDFFTGEERMRFDLDL